MSLRRIVLPAILAVACAGPARAASPGPEASRPTSHERAAAELIAVTRVRENVDQGIDIMMNAQIAANPALGQVEDVLRAFMSR